MEVEAEGREWMRRRLEERLQREADRDNAVFPLSQRKAQHRRQKVLPLCSAVGVVKVIAWHGLDPATGRWGYPIRQRWGLSSHQEMSPGLADKLAFTLTATGAYEEAAAVARKWGVAADDSTLHALAQRLGARAEQQQGQRLETLAAQLAPQRGRQ